MLAERAADYARMLRKLADQLDQPCPCCGAPAGKAMRWRLGGLVLADGSVRAAMTPEHLELARAAGWKARDAG